MLRWIMGPLVTGFLIGAVATLLSRYYRQSQMRAQEIPRASDARETLEQYSGYRG